MEYKFIDNQLVRIYIDMDIDKLYLYLDFTQHNAT